VNNPFPILQIDVRGDRIVLFAVNQRVTCYPPVLVRGREMKSSSGRNLEPAWIVADAEVDESIELCAGSGRRGFGRSERLGRGGQTREIRRGGFAAAGDKKQWDEDERDSSHMDSWFAMKGKKRVFTLSETEFSAQTAHRLATSAKKSYAIPAGA
jgi:hypothetical protein